ncbi:class I SAM-dependent methyltransferase [Candidatus Electrothrix sp.]|uniref:class I SAM-dependent methyltransferase n=1 Tax=Candidatus Electrothrix sp. TaxID=2170559 RepID=UPI0040574EC0
MKNFLQHPLAKNLDLDSPDAPSVHRQIIRSKPFLKKLYNEWYQSIILHLPNHSEGKILEIGSGGGYLNTFIPNIITSDIQLTKDVHLLLDAKELPFSTCSLDAIVMVDVFHHINDVDKFLQESIRCLTENGRIIMVEPWISGWSAVIYNKLHHEPCLSKSKQWSFPDTGPLSGANLALPWIVFKRDRDLFLNKYNKLRINTINLDWPFVYLLSGGVSMKTLVPDWTYPFFRKTELLLKPVIKYIAMFATIVLEKNDRYNP